MKKLPAIVIVIVLVLTGFQLYYCFKLGLSLQRFLNPAEIALVTRIFGIWVVLQIISITAKACK